MSDTEVLALTAEKALNIPNDVALLQAIGAVVSNWGRLATQVRDYASAEALLDAVAAGVNGDAIGQAFTAVGLTSELSTLRSLLGRITGAANQVPPGVRALLSQMSSFPVGSPQAQVSWGLATSNDPVVQTDRYSLNLGGEIGVALDAGASFPGDAPPARRLKISAQGQAQAGASAMLPYALGTIGGGASGSASLALDYYFAAPQSEIYALAVAERLGSLADPFDGDSVWSTLQQSDLDGLVYTFGGAASANLKLSFADARALAAGITVNASFTVDVGASLKSTYVLTLRRAQGAAGFTAQLSRSKVSEATFDDNLGLVIDVSALTVPVAEAIQRAVDQWDTALNSIKPYLSPGTWLRNQAAAFLSQRLTALISNPDLQAAAIADMQGLLGLTTPTQEAVLAWLQGKVTGAIDQGSVLVATDADAAIDKVAAAVTAAVPLLAGQLQTGQLKSLVQDLVGKVQAGLTADVTALFQARGAALAGILNAAGAQVGGAVATLDNALAGVRALLARCDTIFHDILDKAQLAARTKVTARLFRSESRTSGSTVEVSGTFSGMGDDATRAVFKALTRGSLAALERLVDGQETAPGFALDVANSAITRFSRFKSQEGVEVAFIQVLLSASTLIDGGATVMVDGHGDVHVDTQANLTNTLTTPLNSRSTSFADVYKLVQSAAVQADPAAGKPSLSLGVGVSYTDDTLRWSDVASFAQGLDQAHMLVAGALVGAKAAFDRWAPGGGAIQGDIAASVKLAGDAIGTLMQLPARGATGLSDAAKGQIVQAALAAAAASGALNLQNFDAGLNLAIQQYYPALTPPVTRQAAVLAYWKSIGNLYAASQDGPTRLYPPPTMFNSQGQTQYDYFVDQGYALRRVVDLIDQMGAAYQARPSVGGGAGWSQQDYANSQMAMVQDSRMWLTVFNDLVSLWSAQVTPRTTAFLRALLDLSGRTAANPGGLVLTLTWRPDGASPQTVSFG